MSPSKNKFNNLLPTVLGGLIVVGVSALTRAEPYADRRMSLESVVGGPKQPVRSLEICVLPAPIVYRSRVLAGVGGFSGQVTGPALIRYSSRVKTLPEYPDGFPAAPKLSRKALLMPERGMEVTVEYRECKKQTTAWRTVAKILTDCHDGVLHLPLGDPGAKQPQVSQKIKSEDPYKEQERPSPTAAVVTYNYGKLDNETLIQYNNGRRFDIARGVPVTDISFLPLMLEQQIGRHFVLAASADEAVTVSTVHVLLSDGKNSDVHLAKRKRESGAGVSIEGKYFDEGSEKTLFLASFSDNYSAPEKILVTGAGTIELELVADSVRCGDM